MNAHNPIKGAPVRPLTGPSSRGEDAPDAALITADASKLSGLQFLDMLGLSSPEQREASRREMREQCIRAIVRGDTYGWPPMMVAECREIIAERDAEGWELAERSAFGMGNKL